MGKPYSMDLRERVVAGVMTGGLSCNQAAKQFGVGISTAINWMKRLRETGSVVPGKVGGHKPKSISGEHESDVVNFIFCSTTPTSLFKAILPPCFDQPRPWSFGE
jgi:transposase